MNNEIIGRNSIKPARREMTQETLRTYISRFREGGDPMDLLAEVSKDAFVSIGNTGGVYWVQVDHVTMGSLEGYGGIVLYVIEQWNDQRGKS